MIARLTGKVLTRGKDSLVVEVGGVGFQVYVPQTLLDALGSQDLPVSLFTHLHVRESELTLYGFETGEELALFRLLQTVSGIGPKAAMALLSLPPDRLRAALVQEDVAVLTQVPGIGPKTARKLSFELRDKVAAQFEVGKPRAAITEADADLIAALTTLGYSVAEAQEAIRTLPAGPLPLEERVRLALSYFAS